MDQNKYDVRIVKVRILLLPQQMKKFSIGKSIVGGAIGGMINPVGGLIGAASGINGKDGKTTFVCCNCGRVFKTKV